MLVGGWLRSAAALAAGFGSRHVTKPSPTLATPALGGAAAQSRLVRAVPLRLRDRLVSPCSSVSVSSAGVVYGTVIVVAGPLVIVTCRFQAEGVLSHSVAASLVSGKVVMFVSLRFGPEQVVFAFVSLTSPPRMTL